MTSILKMSKHNNFILGCYVMVPLVGFISTIGLYVRRIASRPVANSTHSVNTINHSRLYSLAVTGGDTGETSAGTSSSSNKKGWWSTIWDYTGGYAWEATKNAASAVKDMVAGAAGVVGSVAGSAANAVGNAASTVASGAGTVASTVAGAVGSAASAVGSTVSSVASTVANGTVSAVQSVTSGGSSGGKRSFWTSPWFLGTIISSITVLSALLFFR